MTSKPLNIKDPRAYELAKTLAGRTGETLTQTVVVALRERLERLKRLPPGRDLAAEMKAIADRVCALPVQDDRSEDEILGYNERGVLD